MMTQFWSDLFTAEKKLHANIWTTLQIKTETENWSNLCLMEADLHLSALKATNQEEPSKDGVKCQIFIKGFKL